MGILLSTLLYRCTSLRSTLVRWAVQEGALSPSSVASRPQAWIYLTYAARGRWTVRRPRLLGDFPHAGAVSLSFGAAEPKWLLGQVIMKLSRTRDSIASLCLPPAADAGTGGTGGFDASAPLGSLHGYERMASLSDAGEGSTIPKVTRTVSQALTQTPKSAEADLDALPVSASPGAF